MPRQVQYCANTPPRAGPSTEASPHTREACPLDTLRSLILGCRYPGGHAMEKLAAARTAFAARHWTGAHDGFLTARQEVPLDADDLSALAAASWWLGCID